MFCKTLPTFWQNKLSKTIRLKHTFIHYIQHSVLVLEVLKLRKRGVDLVALEGVGPGVGLRVGARRLRLPVERRDLGLPLGDEALGPGLGLRVEVRLALLRFGRREVQQVVDPGTSGLACFICFFPKCFLYMQIPGTRLITCM